MSRVESDPSMGMNFTLPRGGRAVLANLAFGSLNGRNVDALTTSGMDPGRHLAFVSSDVLELDLSDESQRQFGDYELLELIGEGGMGVVYRARQNSLDREVAIKLLAAGPWASRDFVERFRREAQNAARMQHPNIVTIHEVGTIEELHYFSMRLICGSSLSDHIRAGQLPSPLRAAALLRTIAEAVDYAHRLNVLHLDLKPANVLLDERGEPHVADFGLARRLDRMLVSESGQVSGTPSYMAPEQARAQGLTVATDIWGLGAILYELVTGRPPFHGENAQATLKLMLESPVPAPRLSARTLPLDFEAIILKCLRKDPAERYPTARSLADDLSRFGEGRPVSARPLNVFQRSGRWARREPRIAALVLLVLIALLGGLVATTQQWGRAEVNARVAVANANLAGERLWQSRVEQAATALRDGHSYDALPLLAANIKESEAQGLDAREDRMRIAAAERSGPRLIDILPTNAGISGIAFSPDGASIAVATEDEKLHLFDATTGAQRWETHFAGATHFLPDVLNQPIWLAMLKFSPDGRFIVGRHRQGTMMTLVPMGDDEILFDAATGKLLMPPAERAPNFRDATFSADGLYALVRTVDERAMLVRTADWQALGKPQPFGNPCLLANGGRFLASVDSGTRALGLRDARSLSLLHTYEFSESQQISAWAASPNGASLVVGHADGSIEHIDLASGRREDIHPTPMGRISWVTFSPDGRWFGAVANSGDVLVWDSLTGLAAAPPMRLNVQPTALHRTQMAIDASTRTVLASSDMEMAFWHLPSTAATPVRLSGEFPNIGAYWFRAFAYDAARGLIATDGGGAGEVRLWRVQPLAPIGRRAAPLPSMDLHADDGRVVAVEGNRVSLVTAVSGRAIGSSIELAQMPNFAGLSADGASIVVVAGAALSVYDASSQHLRRAPIALPNSPARILLSPDSQHVFILFADYADGHNRELGQNWDLDTGLATSAPIVVEAQTGLRFSGDGTALALWFAGTLQVLDALSLQPSQPPISIRERISTNQAQSVPDGELAIADVNFLADGSAIDALVVGSANGPSQLWRFDAINGVELDRIPLAETGSSETFARLPSRRAVIVQRPDTGPLWWDDSGGARELPSLGYTEYRALAMSADATMFVRATTDSAIVTSTRSLQWLSPPMPASLPSISDPRSEHPTQLVFSGDGHAIIGRSRRGLWLQWDATPDTRPVEKLVWEATLLNPGPSTSSGALRPPLTETERQSLRLEDPGPPRTHADVGLTEAIPPRRSDAAAKMFDLSAAYNASIREETDDAVTDGEAFPEFAPGQQRFLGVDYDARGAIRLAYNGHGLADATTGATKATGRGRFPRRVEGIRPGISRFAALNVLVTGGGVLRRRERNPYAFVELYYRDGSRERLAIRYLGDVNESASNEDGKPGSGWARIATRATKTGTPRVYATAQQIFAVRLLNPHPQREVEGLAFEAADEAWSAPSFFAVTAESTE